ncbi:MAG: AI-2E family transporter [Candidatus Margulisbacteria bacterium]|jgi:predicted PurR-regulated permease PerM|nr:AI-2E family transporter [Candidatus Margulisiibacteriota bacterium]
MNAKQWTRIASLLLFAALLYLARGALLPIVISLLLFYALYPLVKTTERLFPKKFPWARDISILLAFAVFIVFALLVIEFIIPSFSEEFTQLSLSLPHFITQIKAVARSSQQWYAGFRLPAQVDAAVSTGLNSAFNYISNFLQQLALGLVGMLGQFIGFIVIPVIVYYLLKEDEKLVPGLMKLVPAQHQETLGEVLARTNYILKSYVESQLIICTLIGVVTGLGLYLLGIKFFLVLGLIAGVTELIPIIGPIIGAIPAVIIALLVSPELAVQVVTFYLIVQSVGAYILVPKLVGNKLDLHPLTILLAVLILGNLIGVWGIFFAAPIMAILKVIYLELRKA